MRKMKKHWHVWKGRVRRRFKFPEKLMNRSCNLTQWVGMWYCMMSKKVSSRMRICEWEPPYKFYINFSSYLLQIAFGFLIWKMGLGIHLSANNWMATNNGFKNYFSYITGSTVVSSCWTQFVCVTIPSGSQIFLPFNSTFLSMLAPCFMFPRWLLLVHHF